MHNHYMSQDLVHWSNESRFMIVSLTHVHARRYASHMLIQEEHEQSRKLTVSLHGGKVPAALRKAPSTELSPTSVRSLRERVVATVEEHDDGAYMRVRSGFRLILQFREYHDGGYMRVRSASKSARV